MAFFHKDINPFKHLNRLSEREVVSFRHRGNVFYTVFRNRHIFRSLRLDFFDPPTFQILKSFADVLGFFFKNEFPANFVIHKIVNDACLIKQSLE